MPVQSRLVALSDLYVAFPENRKIVENLRPGSEDDYSYLPDSAWTKEQGLARAYHDGIVCSDEVMLPDVVGVPVQKTTRCSLSPMVAVTVTASWMPLHRRMQ